jgi:6-phospho-beta-glucosidase
MPPLEFRLVGRSNEHLAAVVRAARILSAEMAPMLEISSFAHSQLASALDQADLVLIQIRFGGYEGRHFDETFPLRFGLCGDEGLGPGGLSAAWRGWPAMQQVISTIASVCPQAMVLVLSSPVTLFVRAARRLYPKLNTFGICELPWTTLQGIATQLDAEATAIDFDYLGVNHLGWFSRLDYESCDLLQEYATRPCSSATWPSPEFVGSRGTLPTKYLRLHYDQKKVLDEQRRLPTSRAEVLTRVRKDSYRSFQSGNKAEIRHALEQRPAPWYQHAVVPLLLACSRPDTRVPLFLTLPNGTCETGFRPDDVLEIPTYVSAGDFLPKPCRRPPPSHVRETLNRFVAYERTATEALIQRRPEQIRDALERHPWVGTSALAAAVAAEITTQPQVEAH